MTPARPDRRRSFPLFARALTAACIAVFGIAGLPTGAPAGAQIGGADPAVLQASVPPGGLDAAIPALGIVKVRKDQALGWVAASGTVVTSDTAVAEVGVTATFRTVGSTTDGTCYVGHHVARLHLAVLRCTNVSGPTLGIATQSPAPGAVATVPFLSTIDVQGNPATVASMAGQLLDNNVKFMGDTRLRFSFPVQRNDRGLGTLNRSTIRGAPVLDDQNRVVSVLFAAPTDGGQPLGTTTKEVQDAVDATVSLPESYTAAAVLAIGRRSVIPVLVGLGLGLIWGLMSRNGTTLFKTVGLGLAGVLATVLYSAFTVMVIGPQTLVG